MSGELPDHATPELIAERQAARTRADRRGFATVFSAFNRTMRNAIGQYLTARQQGVDRDDAIRGLEEELRGCWPKSVSKFAPKCQDCDDTGFTEQTCYEWRKCGREVCQKNPERQHTYTEPCACAAGDRMRGKAKAGDDAIVSAGRTRTRRKGGGLFSRIGQ